MVWPKPVGQQEARREWLGLQGTGTSFLLPCTLSCLARMPRIAEVAPGPCTQEEGPAEPGDEISWVCSGGGRGEAVNHLGINCENRARLLATPQTVAYQAPLSVGFSRQEYWSGVPKEEMGVLEMNRLGAGVLKAAVNFSMTHPGLPLLPS